MALTANQLRAARALLNMPQDKLARAAKVAVTSIRQFELGATANLQQKTENALIAFLGQWIEFIGTRGVALREGDYLSLEGKDAIARMFEDINECLRGRKTPEVLFLCGEPCLSSPELAPFCEELGKSGIAHRAICHNDNAPAPLFRSVPASHAPLALQAVYGANVAQMVGPERILLVRSAMLADSLRQSFETMWTMLPALKEDDDGEGLAVAEKPRRKRGAV